MVLEILPKLGLELKVTLLVEQEVLGESSEVLTQSLVERVIGQSGEPDLDLVGELLLMTLVLVGEEVLAAVNKLRALLLTVVVQDPSRLEERSVGVLVDSGEPVSQLGVVLGVGVDLVESIGDAVHRLAIGESLENLSEVVGGTGDSRVRLDVLGSVDSLVGNVLGVALVGAQSIEQPSHLSCQSLEQNREKTTHSLHVVLVLLALDDNLLQSVDELLSSLLGESILNDVLRGVDGVGSSLSVLFRDLLLELVGLVSSLVLSLVSVDVGGVVVGLVGFSVGLTSDLVSLFSERSVGVSRVVEVLGVRSSLVLGLVLELILLLDSLLFGLLSLVVSLTRRSRVALGVGDPTTSAPTMRRG